MGLKIIVKYWRSILCSIVIVIFCFIPGNELPQPGFDIPFLDKLIHCCFYFVLSFIIQYEMKNTIRQKHYLAIFIYAMMLAAFIELVQENLIMDRGGDFFDFFAGLLGVILSFFVFKLLHCPIKKDIEC